MKTTNSTPISYYLDGDDPTRVGFRFAVITHNDGSQRRVSFDRFADRGPASSRSVLPEFDHPIEVRYDRPAGSYLVSDDRRHLFVGRARGSSAARKMIDELRRAKARQAA